MSAEDSGAEEFQPNPLTIKQLGVAIQAIADIADAAAAGERERIALAIEAERAKYRGNPPVVSMGTVENAYEHAARIARIGVEATP